MRELSFKLDEKPAPLVVVDFMVAAWDVFAFMKTYQDLLPEELVKKLIKAAWALKINRGPDMLPKHDYTIVVVSDKRFEDSKMYWRGLEVVKDERIALLWEDYCEKKGKSIDEISQKYKGNRTDRNDKFYQIVEIGWEYVSEYFPSFKAEGYEADDWAGAIYRLSKYSLGVCHDRQILLSTVDRDWSGLVDESCNVWWANTRKPRSNEAIQERLAGEDQVILHTRMKMKKEIQHPLEIYQAKHEYGELGDNLPPGAPIEYIDLSLPHPKYQVENLTDFPKLVEKVNDPNPNMRWDHYKSAEVAFKKVGLDNPWKITV